MLRAVRNAAPEPTAAIIAPTRNRSWTTSWPDAITVRLMYASNELSSPAKAPDPNTNIAQDSLRGSVADCGAKAGAVTRMRAANPFSRIK